MLLKNCVIGHQVALCVKSLRISLANQRFIFVKSGPSEGELLLLQDFQVRIDQSAQVLAALGASQKLIFEWRKHVDFLLKLVLPFDVDFASEAAVLLSKEAETLGLDFGIEFVSNVDVRQSHDLLKPWTKTFDEGDFVVDKNTTILE